MVCLPKDMIFHLVSSKSWLHPSMTFVMFYQVHVRLRKFSKGFHHAIDLLFTKPAQNCTGRMSSVVFCTNLAAIILYCQDSRQYSPSTALHFVNKIYVFHKAHVLRNSQDHRQYFRNVINKWNNNDTNISCNNICTYIISYGDICRFF